jgi:hypothetical protein
MLTNTARETYRSSATRPSKQDHTSAAMCRGELAQHPARAPALTLVAAVEFAEVPGPLEQDIRHRFRFWSSYNLREPATPYLARARMVSRWTTIFWQNFRVHLCLRSCLQLCLDAEQVYPSALLMYAWSLRARPDGPLDPVSPPRHRHRGCDC